MKIYLRSKISRYGRKTYSLCVLARGREFSPGEFSDRRTAERAHDAVLAYFTLNDVVLEGKPFDAAFHASVDTQLCDTPLAGIIGIRGDARGEGFTVRVNTIRRYAAGEEIADE